MGRYDTPLPSILEPTGDICIPLLIPDDPDYKIMLVEHIRKLTNNRRYERGNDEGIRTVQDVWLNRTFKPFLDAVITGQTCAQDTGNCYRVSPANACVQFFPNDPFSFEDTQGIFDAVGFWSSWDNERQKIPTWIDDLINSLPGISLDNIGYAFGDAFVTSPPTADYDDTLQVLIDYVTNVLTSQYPSVKIDLRGTGEVDVQLLSIPFGGTAVIVKDGLETIGSILNALLLGNLSALQGVSFIEVQRDIIQIPPDTIATTNALVEFDGDENTIHSLEVFFVPRFNDELTSPIGLGGGIRHFDICGNLTLLCPGGGEITPNNFGDISAIRSSILLNEAEDVCNDIDPCIDNNSTVQDNKTRITEQEQSAPSNEYPPAPDIQEPGTNDANCGASWYAAEKLAAFIIATNTDAQTLTLPAFLDSIIASFGWSIEALVDFFLDLLNGVSGTFETDINAAIPELAESIYCNGVDVRAGVANFAANGSASLEVREAYANAVACHLDAALRNWIAIGQQDTTRNCSSFTCANLKWRYTWEGSNLATWLDATGVAVFDGTKWIGNTIGANLGKNLQLRKTNLNFSFEALQADWTARATRSSTTDGFQAGYETSPGNETRTPRLALGTGTVSLTYGYTGATGIKTVNGYILVDGAAAGATANDPNNILELSRIFLEGYGTPPAMDGVLTWV